MMNKLRAIGAWLQNFWKQLPHQVQAIITAFVSATVAAATHYFSEAGACYSWACIKHVAPTFVSAGVVAARVFYMLPKGHKDDPPTVTVIPMTTNPQGQNIQSSITEKKP